MISEHELMSPRAALGSTGIHQYDAITLLQDCEESSALTHGCSEIFSVMIYCEVHKALMKHTMQRQTFTACYTQIRNTGIVLHFPTITQVCEIIYLALI